MSMKRIKTANDIDWDNADPDTVLMPEIVDEPANIFRYLLLSMGADIEREGLRETPERYIKVIKEFINENYEFNFTTFDAEGADEMIIESNIPFFSLCEHHILPFFGTATVAYIPEDRIAGLSKLARTIEKFSRRLQNQERITRQAGEFLTENLGTQNVAVILKARHLCQEMRGVRKHDVYTTTSFMQGVFRKDSDARAEIISLIK